MQAQVDSLKKRTISICYVLSLLALAYVALRIVAYIQTAALLLAAAVLLAYLIRPLVTLFNRPITLKVPRKLCLSRQGWRDSENYWDVSVLRRGMPWLAAILVVYAILICIIVVVVSFVVPLVVHEFRNFLSQGLPSLEEQIRTYIDNVKTWLLERLPPEAADFVPSFLAETSNQVTGWASAALHALPPFMGQVVGTVLLIFIVPVLAFYLLVDMDRLRQGLMLLFPSTKRADARELMDKIDDVLSRYIRGQLAVACIIGLTISIVLKLLGLPYAVVIGIFAGFINLIPYVGTPLGMVPAFLVAVFMPNHGGLLKGLIVLLCMYCVHLTEGKIIVPTIVGKSVGLPPLVIIFSLIVGAELLGLPGMLLAVPTASIVRVIIEHWIEKRDRVSISSHHFAVPRELQMQHAEMQQH